MPIPTFLQPGTTITLPDLPEAWASLPLQMQCQQRTDWCWAAVAASTYVYYRDNAAPISFLARVLAWLAALAGRLLRFGVVTPDWSQQCVVANAVLQGTRGRLDCCQGIGPVDCTKSIGGADACNKPASLTDAISVTPTSVDMLSQAVPTFQAIQQEIDNGRVVTLRIVYDGGGGHFLAISGYSVDQGAQTLAIGDPGDSTAWTWSYGTPYQSGGDWTETYWTKKG